MSRGAEIADEARRWIGTPYRHGAAKHGAGADCLGLVRGVYRAVCGVDCEAPPPYAESWAEAGDGERLLDAAQRVLRVEHASDLKVGQVLLFRMGARGAAKHLGIVTSDEARPCFVHSYSRHGVLESPLSAPWRRRVAAVFSFPERLV